jgi:hypothetical protein
VKITSPVEDVALVNGSNGDVIDGVLVKVEEFLLVFKGMKVVCLLVNVYMNMEAALTMRR